VNILGSINKGSFKMNKVATRSKMSNSSYNKNIASKFGNNKFGFKEALKTSNNSFKININENLENK
jgi:hypothetical protein